MLLQCYCHCACQCCCCLSFARETSRGSTIQKKCGQGARGEGAAPPSAMRSMLLIVVCLRFFCCSYWLKFVCDVTVTVLVHVVAVFFPFFGYDFFPVFSDSSNQQYSINISMLLYHYCIGSLPYIPMKLSKIPTRWLSEILPGRPPSELRGCCGGRRSRAPADDGKTSRRERSRRPSKPTQVRAHLAGLLLLCRSTDRDPAK